MASADSTTRVKPVKPKGSPLTVHPKGQWSKKHKQKVYYFGAWEKYDEALEKYERDWPYILDGLDPKTNCLAVDVHNLTVGGLVNLFLQHRVDKGCSPATIKSYKGEGERIIEILGRGKLVSELTPAHFQKIRSKLGKPTKKEIGENKPSSVKTSVTIIKSIFHYADRNDWIDSAYKLFGANFDPPSKTEIKKSRNTSGKIKVLKPETIRKMLDVANVHQKAIILLGINVGINNKDATLIRRSDIDWETGLLDSPRGKSGENRAGILWPETLQALKDYLAEKPTPKLHADRDKIFIGRYGNPIANPTGFAGDAFTRCAKGAGVYQPGMSYKILRTTFRNTASNLTKDYEGVKHVVGQDIGDIDWHYQIEFWTERLQDIADAVHGWLFDGTEVPK